MEARTRKSSLTVTVTLTAPHLKLRPDCYWQTGVELSQPQHLGCRLHSRSSKLFAHAQLNTDRGHSIAGLEDGHYYTCLNFTTVTRRLFGVLQTLSARRLVMSL